MSQDPEAEGNPFLRRMAKEPSNGHGKKSEAKLMKKMGALPTPNSGARRGGKSDGTVTSAGTDWRIESKCTVNDRLPIDIGWMVKITHEAYNTARTPLVTLSWVMPDGSPRPMGEWVCIPLSVWQELQGDK